MRVIPRCQSSTHSARNAAQLGQKILIALDRAGHHRREKQNESQVFADGAFFGPVPVAIHRVVDELKREKRNAQRQKRVLPVEGIVRRIVPEKPGQEIAIFEKRPRNTTVCVTPNQQNHEAGL